MALIGDLDVDAHDGDGVAFTAPGRSTGYTYREFRTAAWKAGNLLRHYGVHEGATVTVLVGPSDPDAGVARGRLGDTPEPLFGILGAWLLGGVVDLDRREPIDGSVVIGPARGLDRVDVSPGCSRLGYGASPTDPETGHFERERWSENPVEPPNEVSVDAVALVGEEPPTQQSLTERARRAVADGSIRADDHVEIDCPLGPTPLALGVLAPLAAGATIVGGGPTCADVRVDDAGATRLSE